MSPSKHKGPLKNISPGAYFRNFRVFDHASATRSRAVCYAVARLRKDVKQHF